MAAVLLFILGFIFCSGIFVNADENDEKKKPLCCAKLTNGSFSTHCQRVKLWAGGGEGSATTPNFPGRFPILQKCIWEIYTRAGRRIRLDFRDFYLIGPGDNGVCYSQHVIVKAPLSGLQVGPHCGNAGIPSVVSAGNFLVVELISNIPMTTENYRGFRMSFIETSEMPNRQLVSQNMKDDIILSKKPSYIPKERSPKPTLGPKRSPKLTTKRPSRIRFGQRLPPPRQSDDTFAPSNLLTDLEVYQIDGHARPPVYDDPDNVEREKETPSGGISPMIIVGIAAAGIIAIALLFTYSLKAWKRYKENSKDSSRSKDVEKTKSLSSTPNSEDKSSLPSTQYLVYFYQDSQKNNANRSKSRERNQTEEISQKKQCSKRLKAKSHEVDKLDKVIEVKEGAANSKSKHETKSTKSKGKRVKKSMKIETIAKDISTSTRKNKENKRSQGNSLSLSTNPPNRQPKSSPRRKRKTDTSDDAEKKQRSRKSSPRHHYNDGKNRDRRQKKESGRSTTLKTSKAAGRSKGEHTIKKNTGRTQNH